MERTVQKYFVKLQKTGKVVECDFDPFHYYELHGRCPVNLSEPVFLTKEQALTLVNKWNRSTDKFKYWI
jgi:hypothetical protein